MTSVKVAVRCRPFNKREKAANSNCIIRMEGADTYIKNPVSIVILLSVHSSFVSYSVGKRRREKVRLRLQLLEPRWLHRAWVRQLVPEGKTRLEVWRSEQSLLRSGKWHHCITLLTQMSNRVKKYWTTPSKASMHVYSLTVRRDQERATLWSAMVKIKVSCLELAMRSFNV